MLKRNLGVAVAHGLIMHWQNLLSDGRFNLPEIWALYETYLPWMTEMDKVRGSYRPQVAVVIDERSYDYQRVACREVFGRWVYELRSGLNRVDTTFGYYLQSDLDKIPDSARCLILLTPYVFTPEQRKALETRWMTGGRTVVFCYLPDVFSRDDVAPSVSPFCGIDLELHQDAIDPESAVASEGLFKPWNGERFGDARDVTFINTYPEARLGPVSPYLTVVDDDAEILARYAANGLPSCAIKDMGDWHAVYLGTHRLTPALWRALFAHGGCHLYLERLSEDWERPDVIEANERFLMVQCGQGGEKTVRLPRVYDRIERFDGTREVIASNTDHFAVQVEPMTPSFFIFE